MCSEETIREKLKTDESWACKAILTLFARQTMEEQDRADTHINNKQGFNSVDAPIMTSFARQIECGRRLSSKQLNIAFRVLPKYAHQLYLIGIETGRNTECTEKSSQPLSSQRASQVAQPLQKNQQYPSPAQTKAQSLWTTEKESSEVNRDLCTEIA